MTELIDMTADELEREWDYLEDLEEPKPDYSNSGPLDIHLYSEDKRVEEAATDLCTEIGYDLNRANTHMKVVLLNLYWAHLLSPDRWIGYSRNNNRYGIPRRYNVQRIEVHPLTKVVDGLIDAGYVEPAKFYFNGKAGEGRCSRMRATAKLVDMLEDKYRFTIKVVGRHPDEEVIILKDTKVNKKKTIDYKDNKDTPKRRKFLNQYNEFIQKTYIDFDYMGYVHKRELRSKSLAYLGQLPMKLHFDITKRKMKRIFNNKSFTQGGRFYGGFWMELPSQLRLRLIIDMQKVVEADYSGIHIHLLYNQEGIDYGITGQDPYDIPGYGNTKQHRNMFKKLLLAAINAKAVGKTTGETKAIQALQKDINFKRSTYPDEIPKLTQVLKDFREHHGPIAKYLCTGEGLKLMYQDSQIAELVMKTMLRLHIPVLPVHDSFVCPKQHSELLIAVMTKAYRKVTGNKLTVTPYTVNIKEPDEWNRDKDSELFPDDNYYFDLQYTEDIRLIEHMVKMDGNTLYDETEEEADIQQEIVAPHVLYVRIPIEYRDKENNIVQI